MSWAEVVLLGTVGGAAVAIYVSDTEHAHFVSAVRQHLMR
jgi:hypothetical protein